MHRTPATSPTGTAQIVTANQNIIVEGGAWDQDYPNNTGGTLLGQMLMVIGAVAHSRVRDVVLKNAAKYTLEFGAVYDFEADCVSADSTTSDVIKVYGPAVAGMIQNVAGTSNDDTLSLQGKEAAAFIGYAWTWGDMINVTGQNIHANSITPGNNVCTVYGSASEYTGGIVFRNIGGAATNNGVAVIAGYANSRVDDVTIDNSQASGFYGVRLGVATGTGHIINQLIVRGPKYVPAANLQNQNGYLQDPAWTATTLSFYDIDASNPDAPAGVTYWGAVQGPVGTANFFGGRLNGVSTALRFIQFTAAVTTINCNGFSVGANAGNFIVLDPGAGTPTVNVTGCNFDNPGPVVGISVPCTVVLSGNRFNMGANGVCRSDVAVVAKIKSGGNNFVAGAIFTNGSATGLWELYGFDIPVDVGATGVQKTISGQYCFNTTIRGTLQANRLVTCGATQWAQVDTPANVF